MKLLGASIKTVRLKLRLLFFSFPVFSPLNLLIINNNDKLKTTYMSFDIKFIRLEQKHVGLARQASPFLRCLDVAPDKHVIKRH